MSTTIPPFLNKLDTQIREIWEKHYASNVRRFSNKDPDCCSDCAPKVQLRRHACCEQATLLNCVCAIAITCPTHGQKHWGIHD